VLLVGHWLIRKGNPFTEKLFRVLAGVQIALLFVIMASAGQRLILLTGSLGYGLTTVRLYPMIFMSWLALVFILFAVTVLRGSRKYFAWGALWSAFTILGVTHFINPDALIVNTNVRLMREGRPFDAVYNSRLSDDAIPVLVRSVDAMNIADREVVLRELSKRNCRKQEAFDLRSWNVSRFMAANTLQASASIIPLSPCDAELETIDLPAD
jgi:hypothetical protein